MAKKTSLVHGHLERVASRLLEDYQSEIREYTRKRHGIYALYKGDRLYYVGLASSLQIRLKQHLKDRHRGKWDRFSIYLTETDAHMRELESLVVRIADPKGNKQTGRLAGSRNIKGDLSRELRDRHRKEMAVLFNDHKPIRKQKPKRRKQRGGGPNVPLEPWAHRRFQLRADYKGETYKATVRVNGWIYRQGYLYANPTAAARDIVGRDVNGWHFWKVKNASGEWVPLNSIRK